MHYATLPTELEGFELQAGTDINFQKIAFLRFPCLRRLLPLGVDTQQTAHDTGKTNDAVVKGGPAQGGHGHSDVAKIGDELSLAGGAFAKSSC